MSQLSTCSNDDNKTSQYYSSEINEWHDRKFVIKIQRYNQA